jgi:hypothetical protein
MRKIKFCGIGILIGAAIGAGLGQLVLALMKSTGGLLLARDIFGAVYGVPVLGAWLGYYVGAWLEETWKP